MTDSFQLLKPIDLAIGHARALRSIDVRVTNMLSPEEIGLHYLDLKLDLPRGLVKDAHEISLVRAND